MLGDYIYWCCIGVGAVAALAAIALLRAFVCSFDHIDQSVSFMCPFYHIYQSVSLWCCSGSFPLSLLMRCSSFDDVFVGVLYCVSLSLSLYVLFRSCSCSFSSSSSFDRIYPSVSLSCHTVSFSPSLRTVLIFFLLFFFFVVVVLLPMILLFLLRTVE